jgi:hypothetical protein
MSAFVIFCLTIGFAFNSRAAEPEWQTDNKIYKLVCDPTKMAEFLRGLVGKRQCIYMESSHVEYMKSHDRPCDKTTVGQFLDGLLGRACETTRNLTISNENYEFFKSCDKSAWHQFKAGLLHADPCKYKYDVKREQRPQVQGSSPAAK